MRNATDGSSHAASHEALPERPGDPPDPEIERRRRVLNHCVARHYEELMSAARTWLGRTARGRLGAKAFEARARSAVHTAYLRACKPGKLAEFDSTQGDPRKWLFGFIHTITRELKTRDAREHKHQTNAKRATITPISQLATPDHQRLSHDDQLSHQNGLDGVADDYLPDDVRAELAKGDTGRLLRLLPAPDAELLRRKDLDGMTYEEIAAETGEKAATLRKQAERARKKLREADGGPVA